MEIHICLYREKGKLSHGFHLFQEGLFPFFSLLSLPEIIFTRFFSFLLDSSVGLPVPDDFGSDSSDGLLKVCLLQLTLPNDDNAPAFRLQLAPDFLITLLVSGNLSHPELCVGLGNGIILTVFVAMPEAAMYEDNCPILWQHDIWFPGKTFIIHSVTKPLAP